MQLLVNTHHDSLLCSINKMYFYTHITYTQFKGIPDTFADSLVQEDRKENPMMTMTIVNYEFC